MEKLNLVNAMPGVGSPVFAHKPHWCDSLKSIRGLGLPFVAVTDNKFVNAVARVNFHDIPENGHTTYFYHWLWSNRSLFAKPSSKPAG